MVQDHFSHAWDNNANIQTLSVMINKSLYIVFVFEKNKKKQKQKANGS